jgi:beta-mannosidase
VLRQTSLDSGWEFACPSWFVPDGRVGYSQSEWLPARVPGHVHRDLVDAKVIADPFTDLAELGCQWVDQERWSYRTSFEFHPEPSLPRRVLHFAGLDTVCSVFLDGIKLAEHDDMFVPLEIDVSSLAPGRHELRVDFESAAQVGRERRGRYLASEGLADDVVRFDERAFVRKAQYMYGWDWGPRLVSAGIWRSVSLIEHAGRLLDVLIEQVHGQNGSVELRISSEHEGGARVLHFLDQDPTPIHDGDPHVLRNPELWWPAGCGAQPLYTLASYLVPEGVTSREAAERNALDRRVTRIGLRRVRLVREPDAAGESFEFEVNGRRIWSVGANWIPDHSFPSLVTRERLRDQLGRARDMNMNMLRVWGGGLYESDDFYELCDELGLLVWQDFPYACQYYPEDPITLASARRQARENVKRLRNHPSLVLWCGNNENLMMFEAGWDDPTRHPPRYYGEKLYAEVLPAVLAELDPSRPYIPTSPWGGTPSNSGGIGDQHYWDVWHGRGDWKHYEDSSARFASEFGFASAPGPRSWRKALPSAPEPLAVDVRDPRVRWHDKTLKGYETFLGLVALHYPEPKQLEEWTYFSQLNQRDALRHGIEHFRRSSSCKGSLIWQLNDCWPVQSWAVLDSEGDYKAAAHELKRLYAHALACLVVADGEVRLFTLLDNSESVFNLPVRLEARSTLDGSLLAERATSVTLGPSERLLALELDVRSFPACETLVVATFAGTTTFRLLSEPKDVRLVTPRLSATLAGSALTVTSDVPVVDLFLWDPAGAARFEQNFLTLPAGGSVTLGISQPPSALLARSLAGAHPISLAR